MELPLQSGSTVVGESANGRFEPPIKGGLLLQVDLPLALLIPPLTPKLRSCLISLPSHQNLLLWGLEEEAPIYTSTKGYLIPPTNPLWILLLLGALVA